MVNVFFSYSHADENLRDVLEKHLSLLKRQHVIDAWHDRRLSPGEVIDEGITKYLETADIILLLVSSDFLASDYCFSREMRRAMERHEAGSARVIPIILRDCDWHSAPFGKLLALPGDGKPIMSRANQDEAFAEVARALRGMAHELSGGSLAPVNSPVGATPVDERVITGAKSPSPRSSNLRLKKQFTDLEQSAFLEDSFEFISRYFQESLEELKTRNEGIDGRVKNIDGTRFSAFIYRDGKEVAACAIGLEGVGGRWAGNITFSFDASARGGSYNESLSVEQDGYSLYFRALGMQAFSGREREQLSAQGAAEHLWALFIRRLQE